MTDSVSQALQQRTADLTIARAHPAWAAAVAYLRNDLSPKIQAQVRAVIQTADWPAAYHMGWGMAIRNALRKAGFGEADLGIANLDNVYVELVEEAVQTSCPHPEFDAVVDVYRGPVDGEADAHHRFEAAIRIRCRACQREMLFLDAHGSRVLRVRLDPCPSSIAQP